MSASASPLAAALAPLFQALDDAEGLLRHTHPDLPLDEAQDTPAPDTLLADTVLLLIDNLRAAARAYHRERHLVTLLPPH